MKNKKTNIFLIVLVVVILLWMLKGTFFQPGAGDLQGGFKEVAKYRNENNTGPVQYIFAVSVKDTLWSEMQTYGNYKPHFKGGVTKVYYFLASAAIPKDLEAGDINFDPSFNASCVAVYQKSAMGNISLTRYPFK